MPTKKKTKIVATVGPASQTPEVLAELVKAGVNVFRLNMAHGGSDWHDRVLSAIRRVERDRGKPIGVLADLSGPKIRVGEIESGGVYLEMGAKVRFVNDPADVQTATDLTTTYDQFFGDIQVGDSILLSDGGVRLRALEKNTHEIICVVEQAGAITSHSGINLPGVNLSSPALTPKDEEDVAWIAKNEIDFVGLSFVRSPADVTMLREKLSKLGSEAAIISKIEKPEALAQLDEIVALSDAVMVARGDLGVEIDIARIAVVQREIIQTCRKFGKPVITATQMLESMRTQRIPTRAEATDVAHAIFDGTDATMLSAETAVGDHPAEVVKVMSRIAVAAEDQLPDFVRDPRVTETLSVDQVLKEFVESAGQLADRVAAKLVFVASSSGRTARAFSKVRSRTRTVAIGPNQTAIRQMCLYWGVEPKLIPRFDATEMCIEDMAARAVSSGAISPGDRIVFVDGENTVTSDRSIVVKLIS